MTTTEHRRPLVPVVRRRRRPDRKLAIICSKGNLDMAYPGLILANAALGEGVETHLFFTFWGFDMINKKTMGDLKFTMLGNTATHMPQGLGGLPGMTAMATHQLKKSIADLGVPEVPEFLAADRRLRRPPVGVPDVGRHAAPRRGRPLRRGRGHHQRLRLHREDRGRPAALHLSPREPGRPLGPGRTVTFAPRRARTVPGAGSGRAGGP